MNLAQTRYVYLGRHLIGKDGAPGSHYLHTDALGSLVAETDASQTVTQRYHYLPYGAAFGTMPDGPGYAGNVMDPSGLVYMQARYYDPQLGRFLSTDPVDPDPQTGTNFNRYGYADSNPYSKYDPDGRYTCNGADSNCRNFERAMTLARDAASSARLTTAEEANLRGVTDFIGTPDDGNKVIVQFKDDPSRGGYAAFNSKDDTTTLTIRPDNDIKNLGKNAVHEGEHGYLDSQRGRGDETRDERLQNEVSAYTTQAYYQKALEYSSSSQDPWTYVDGVSEENIDNKAESSVDQACGSETNGSCGN